MNVVEIESKLKALADEPFDPSVFPYRILEAYDAPRATVKKLQNGSMNKGEQDGDVLWKGKFFFRRAPSGKAAATLDLMMAAPAAEANRPRFLVSSDGEEVSGIDTKSGEKFHVRRSELNEQFDFFLPLAGVERFKAAEENPADIKAANRLAKFYDAILERNPEWKSAERRHELNLFMTRVLFCMFAEDTGIIAKDLFTRTVDEFTDETDGGDVHQVLGAVFAAMDRKEGDRNGLPTFAKDFPYVNGGLFRERTAVPFFSRKARQLLIDAAQLNWAEINPDIFGSMIQAVVDPSLRGDLGMHYTSVPNIMKLIKPLFLDRLEKEFEASKDNPKRLEKLLSRIYRIRVFDPACGSGNFLIISYRELRRLEMRIFKRLQEISPQFALPMSQVRLSQFYGIEYADFAAETAKLSLWISEYQVNKEFEGVFGSAPPALPLKDSGNIVTGNALRLSWSEICPVHGDSETFVVGNPPYLGSTYQTDEQKSDMKYVFANRTTSYKNLDYVAAWYLKGAEYIQKNCAECAFVATNSICQGEQVPMLWPLLFSYGIEISFAHTSFKWKNNAAYRAGVTCVIVGIRKKTDSPKLLISSDMAKPVRNIGPYLIEMEDLVVNKLSRPLSHIRKMEWGNKATDGGFLILSSVEKDSLLARYPEAASLVRRYIGSQEMIRGIIRWCLWIEDDQLELARSIPEISSRIDAVDKFRASSKAAETRGFSGMGHKFRQIQNVGEGIIVPRITSEKRNYIPCAIIDKDVIASDQTYVIYGGEPYLMAIISSRLHLVWVSTVCGQMETRIRYSNTLGYNTFPVPELSSDQKQALEDCAWKIIEEREANPGKTISELYDPKTMPKGLLQAHQDLDATLETIYRGRQFKDDTERLEHLFKLYAARTGKAGAGNKGRAA